MYADIDLGVFVFLLGVVFFQTFLLFFAVCFLDKINRKINNIFKNKE